MFINPQIASGNAWRVQCSGSRRKARRALLDDHPLVHEDDLAGDATRKAHFMRDDEHRHALERQRTHHLQHFATKFGVERRCRLVEQQDLGLHRQRTGNRDALLLATGQPGGIGISLRFDVDLFQQPFPMAMASSRPRPRTRIGASMMFCSTVIPRHRLNC